MTAIENISREEHDKIIKKIKKYSETTLKKHEWVKRIYSEYCATIGVDELFPIAPQTITRFIKTLSVVGKYAFGSIQDVIIPGIKRINKELGYEISEETNKEI